MTGKQGQGKAIPPKKRNSRQGVRRHPDSLAKERYSRHRTRSGLPPRYIIQHCTLLGSKERANAVSAGGACTSAKPNTRFNSNRELGAIYVRVFEKESRRRLDVRRSTANIAWQLFFRYQTRSGFTALRKSKPIQHPTR